MTAKNWADVVYAQLKRGGDGAITYGDLAERLNVSVRIVYEAIRVLRLRGFAVATSGNGVWVADSAADLDVTLKHLRGRVRSQYATYAAVKRVQGRLRAIEDRGEVEQLWLDMEAA